MLSERLELRAESPKTRCSRTVTGREKNDILDRLNRLPASHSLASTRRKHAEIREACGVVDLCHTYVNRVSITSCRKSL